MKCMIWSRDLMFSSQATASAGQAGMALSTIASAGDVEEESLVILDLSMPGLDVANAIAECDARNARVIAVGPHVHGEKLEAARDAGAYRVLTKGQAHRELGAVLQEAAQP